MKLRKNITKLVAFALGALFLLTGCGQFADGGGSVWQGGLWIIPTLTFLGSAWFFQIAYRASKSGSTYTKEDGTVIDQPNVNVPIYKIGQFYFSVALFVATVIIIFMINSEK